MKAKDIFRYAFMRTLPIFCSYIFLGISFGILWTQTGLSFIWTPLMSLIVYAGSLQYALIPLVMTKAPLLTIAAMTLFVNARHIFYGLSFVDRFKKTGRLYPYMIFSLCDETFSLFCLMENDRAPEAAEPRTWVLVSALDHGYWVLGSFIGALLGQVFPFDLTGIDFAMSALFCVILMGQLESRLDAAVKEKKALPSVNRHGRGTIINRRVLGALLPAGIGFASAIIFLIILGADDFLLPSLVTTVVVLLVKAVIDESKNRKKE